MIDPVFIGILLIPVIISLFCKFALRWDISWIEFGIQIVAGVVALSLIWFIGNNFVGMDREVLNGQVTAKHVRRFSCETNTSNPCTNGYICHSHEVCSGSGKDRTCHEEHDTCYVYDWEQNWYADTNLMTAQRIQIDRVDQQGAAMPQRYSSIRLGDPAASTHTYKNWVKASAGSLFRQDETSMEANKSLMVDYPLEITDYYNINRIITPNYKLANASQWNTELARILEPLGPSKQLNVVVVIVNNVDREYAFGLRRHWEGFKKNDAVIVIGLSNGNIAWSETMSWSKNALFNVEMRHMVEDQKGTAITAIDPAQFMKQVADVSQKDFVRRPMKEFEYLKGDISPPNWLIITSLIIAVLLGVGTSVLFNRIDIQKL